MSVIIDYVSDLLYRNECVVVPGFGALVTRRIPAKLDDASGEMHPPRKNILYNGHITENDGLLVNYIADIESISYNSARYKVEEFVQQQLKTLSKDGKLNWNKLGLFTKSGAEIHFTPSYVLNHLDEAYGLSSFSIKALQENNAQEESSYPELAVVNDQENEDSAQSRGWLKYAAAIVVAVGISSILGYQAYEKDRAEHQIAVEQLADQKLKEKIQDETIAIASPLPQIEITAQPVVTPPKDFHLIAGAFRSAANAERKIRVLKEQGYNAHKVGINRYGLHTVAIESFETRQEAVASIGSLRNAGHQGVWLFIGQLPD